LKPLSPKDILADSRELGPADGLTLEEDLERRLGRRLTAMDMLQVIEVRNAGRPAWLTEPLPHRNDSITFDIEKAHVFVDWHRVRDTLSRLRCGYPQWVCVGVAYNEHYRAEFAKNFSPDPALEGPVKPTEAPSSNLNSAILRLANSSSQMRNK
jgi:hypothetical protein